MSVDADLESRAKRTKIDKLGRSAAFQKLKGLKGSKNKYEVCELQNVYDIVDEKEYNRKVLSRQDEDWIVDDDGNGYIEDGRDVFDDDLDTKSITASKTLKTRSRKRKALSEDKCKGNIQFMLSNIKKTEERNCENDEILSELMQEIDEDNSKTIHPYKCRKTLNNSLSAEKQAAKDYMKSFTIPSSSKSSSINRTLNNTEVIENTQKQIFIPEKILPLEMKSMSSDRIKNQDIDSKENNEQNLIEESQETICSLHETSTSKFSISNEIISLEDDFVIENIENYTCSENKQNEENEITEEQLLTGWNTLREGSINDEVKIDVNIDSSDLPVHVNEHGNKVFKFFWWDAFEDRKTQSGVVFFFGKTYCESKKSYVSCCVAVKNIERKIFLLPRQFHKSDDSKPVTLLDVYHEFNKNVALKLKLNNFKSKKTIKNYAFDSNVPTESEYLEVRYSAKSPTIPTEFQSGDTYARILGLNTSYLEIILLEQRIKGPCWLEVINPELVTNSVSWCKLEVNCSKVSYLLVQDGSKLNSPPPLVIATLNLRTVISRDKSGVKNEIVMLSCIVHNKYFIDKQIPNPPFEQHFCIISRPDDVHLPLDIHNALQNYKGTKVQRMDSEKALLNYFIIQLSNIDPDLVVGHDLQGYQLDILCARLRYYNIYTFSKLSKLKRTEFPYKTKFDRELFCGRLVCDIKISAKELIKSRSFDLDILCQRVLKLKENQRINFEVEDIPRMYQTSTDIIKLITITMQDTAYILKIMYELNVIPMLLQITNIAGNVMSRTLLGGRSERNEYLLLHAFTEKNFLVPDKIYDRKKIDNTDTGDFSTKRKPKYSGGLVLDPKIGFYDKLILLMDFNSLYPSIIQEYNVCFTTILSNENGVCSFITDKNKLTGILPTEIRKLVESRKEVKKLMNNVDISSELYVQYNIRQMALKLTANSMYGCLGFLNSRFYAKNLAAFITQKGREILTNTKDSVERMSYEIIYGDTDSIMVYTNSLDYDEVFKIGNKIKQEINKLYRQIELDIDGVFKYLLLLKKKKYAAVLISKTNTGEVKLTQEHKGLDIVRRDWSQLSAECGKTVLNYILSADSLEEKISKVQSHLIKVKNDLQNDAVPLFLLMITKQLTKHPKEYSDKNILPHVQVALRYNQKGGKQLQSGDTVHYIICDDGSNLPPTQRAYHIEELKNTKSLKLDVKYYLEHQIYPVISRLCESIAGLDGYEIASWLGLDVKYFKKPKEKSDPENVQYNDNLKYRNCKAFVFQCFSCKTANKISEPVFSGTSFLEKCANSDCSVRPIEYLSYISNQLTMSIHSYIKNFYKFEMTCEDPACLNNNNFIAVNLVGKYSLCNICHESTMYMNYSSKDLHMQLSYFHNLFELSKNGKRRHINPNLELGYNSLKNIVYNILNHSGFNRINLTNMFMPFTLNKDIQENAILENDRYDSEDDVIDNI